MSCRVSHSAGGFRFGAVGSSVAPSHPPLLFAYMTVFGGVLMCILSRRHIVKGVVIFQVSAYANGFG